MYNPLRAVTHNSKFHADDVFATVVLRKLYPDMQLTRTRDPDVIASADIAYDLSGMYDHAARRYDHHQRGARKRQDTGITYSAFGLIWDHYGREYCAGDEEVWRRVDDIFVRGIDADDNGELKTHQDAYAPEFTVPQIIRQLNPLSGSDEVYDEQFEIAVRLATELFERLCRQVKNECDDMRAVRTAQRVSSHQRVAILDHAIVMNSLISTIDQLEYVIFPDGADPIWRLYAVNEPGDRFAIKAPLPQEWAGLRDEDMVKVSGVSDATFCHKNRFLAVAKTRDGAWALLKKALEMRGLS